MLKSVDSSLNIVHYSRLDDSERDIEGVDESVPPRRSDIATHSKNIPSSYLTIYQSASLISTWCLPDHCTSPRDRVKRHHAYFSHFLPIPPFAAFTVAYGNAYDDDDSIYVLNGGADFSLG